MEGARNRHLWGFAILTTGAAVIPYLNSLAAGYAFDDYWVVVENPLVQRREPLEVFRQVYLPGPHYRPLGLLTFMFNEVVGGNPFGYHLFNILAHAAVSVLVFLLARRLLENALAALFAALLFAIHPVHTEAVTSVVGRYELLSAASVLAALLAFARSLGADPRARWWYWISVLLFAAGPFAKENAIAALPMLFLVHLWLAPAAPWRRRFLVLVPYALAMAVYLVLRLKFTGAVVLPAKYPLVDNTLAHVPDGERILTALVILWQYVGLLAFPVVLSADYSYNQIPVVESLFDPRLLIALAGFAALALLVLAVRKRAPVLLFGSILALVAIAPTSNLPFAIGTMKAERLLYLPSFGWCLALGWLAARAYALRPSLAAPLLVAVLLVFGFRTWVRNPDWTNDTTLFEATTRTSPNSARAHHNLGVAYTEAKRYDEAMIEFRRALQIYPGNANSAYAIGRLYRLRGIPAGAVAWFERAIAIDWNYYLAHQALGEIRQEQGEYATAEAAFRTAAELEPDKFELRIMLAAPRLREGDRWEAARLLDDAAIPDWMPSRAGEQIAQLRRALLRELD